MPLGTSIPVIVAPYGSFFIHRNIGRLQTLQQRRAECGEGVGEHGVTGGEIHAVILGEDSPDRAVCRRCQIQHKQFRALK